MAKQRENGISWTDETWNPLRGCTRVSEGCRNCYAEGVAARFSKPGQPYAGLAAFVGAKREPRWTGKVALAEHLLDQPLRWRKPRRIFVNSMSDLFHESVPDEWIDRIFAVMALCPEHTFQVLTKRPERMQNYVTHLYETDEGIERLSDAAVAVSGSPCAAYVEDVTPPIHNIWLGVSVEDQATADERIPLLLDTPAAKRFISAEPLLGPVDLTPHLWGKAKPCDECPQDGDCGCGFYPRGAVPNEPALDWIIVGGESGPNARPMHPDWVRSLRDQCAAAGVSFFFKQWGEWAPHTANLEGPDGSIRTTPKGGVNWSSVTGGPFGVFRVGKKAAGALLDGREHREFPA